MIDFSLTERDRELADMARADALFARKFARYYDHNNDELEPQELPGSKDRPDPFALLEADPSGTSGPVLTQALFFLEHPDVRLRPDTRRTIGTKIVNYAGTEEQKQRLGHLLLSIAITEPGAGSDPRVMRGSARFDEQTDEWVLNGEKIYCSGFGEASGAVVMVKGPADEDGRRPFMGFIVEKGAPGLQLLGQVDKMGLHSWDTEDFVMQDCRVPAANKLDVDFKRFMTVFNGSRSMITAMGLSYARYVLDMVRDELLDGGRAIDYGKGRNARSALEDRFIQLEAEHDATRLMVLHSKWFEQRNGLTHRETMIRAASAKALGGTAMRRITHEAMELLGPAALTEERLAEKWFRDARIFDIFEGAGEINRLIVARWLLGYSAKELN